jgi:hypothetical protein
MHTRTHARVHACMHGHVCGGAYATRGLEVQCVDGWRWSTQDRARNERPQPAVRPQAGVVVVGRHRMAAAICDPACADRSCQAAGAGGWQARAYIQRATHSTTFPTPLCRPPTARHQPPHNTRTCAALLNTGVGAPPFQLAMTTSSRVLPSRGVPTICLFMLSTYARWCLPARMRAW